MASRARRHLTSVFLCLKHEIAAISDGGAILNNASIAAVSGTPTLAAYTAAKHGVLGLTRSTALELVDRGVRVNALITGNVDTPLYRRLSGLGPHDSLPPAPNPTGRTASTEEIASFVAYLLSDETTFITGAALTADGGYTASCTRPDTHDRPPHGSQGWAGVVGYGRPRVEQAFDAGSVGGGSGADRSGA